MITIELAVPPVRDGARIRVGTITQTTSAHDAKVEHYHDVVCSARLLGSEVIEMVLLRPLNGGAPIDIVAFRIEFTIVRNLKQIRSRVRDAVGLGTLQADWLIERLSPIAWPEGVMGPVIKNTQELEEEIEKRQIRALKLVLQAHKVAGFVIPSAHLCDLIHSPNQLGLGQDSRWTIFDPWSGRDPMSLVPPSMRLADPLTLQQFVVQHPILSQSRWLLDGQRSRFHLPYTDQEASKPEYSAKYPNTNVVFSTMKVHPGALTERITTYIPGHCQDYEATEYGTTYRLDYAPAQRAPPIIANNIPTFNQPGLPAPAQMPLAGHARANPIIIPPDIPSALKPENRSARGLNSTMLPLVPPFKISSVRATTQPVLPAPNQVPVAGYAPTRSSNVIPAVRSRSSVLDGERATDRPAKRQRVSPPEAELPRVRAANTTARGINIAARSLIGGIQATASVNKYSSGATTQNEQLPGAPVLPARAMQGVEARMNDRRANKRPSFKPEPDIKDESDTD